MNNRIVYLNTRSGLESFIDPSIPPMGAVPRLTGEQSAPVTAGESERLLIAPPESGKALNRPNLLVIGQHECRPQPAAGTNGAQRQTRPVTVRSRYP